MPVDLHLHSTYSDGTEPPSSIARQAAESGLGVVALTDHDNLGGVTEMRAACRRVGVGFIPGTELSVDWPTGTMHLLVYFLEPQPGPLQDRLGALQHSRAMRNRRIVDRLLDLGYDVGLGEIQAEAGSDVVGRPHIAAVLLAKGYVESINDAFDRLLGVGRPAYVERERLEAHEAVDLARRSGAVPVIAHPHTVAAGADDYAEAFTSLVDTGLGGIEAYYGEYPPELRAHLVEVSRRLGVVPTGGSDYHGAYKPGLRVGVGRGDLFVPDEVVEELEGQRAITA